MIGRMNKHDPLTLSWARLELGTTDLPRTTDLSWTKIHFVWDKLLRPARLELGTTDLVWTKIPFVWDKLLRPARLELGTTDPSWTKIPFVWDKLLRPARLTGLGPKFPLFGINCSDQHDLSWARLRFRSRVSYFLVYTL
jgi:hypothetical protein